VVDQHKRRCRGCRQRVESPLRSGGPFVW